MKKKGFYVIGVDIQDKKISNFQNFVDDYFQFDISSDDFVESFIEYINKSNLKVNGIFHLAGLKKSEESFLKQDDYWNTNFIGTLNVAKVAKHSKVSNFIFSSSCSVYGDLKDIRIKERSVTIPISPYGNSKLAAEKFLMNFATNNFNLIILRFFNVAGCANNFPDQSSTNIFPKLSNAYLKNEPFIIFGDTFDTKDGTCIRDYVHIQDIVDGHILSWEKLNLVDGFSEIINLGSETGFSVKEVVESFQQVLNNQIKVKIGNRRRGDPESAVSCHQKAKDLLNYHPRHSLVDMVLSHIRSSIK